MEVHFFLLPFIFLLWANLHAGFSAGLVLFALYLLAKLYRAFRDKNLSKVFLADISVFLLSLAATIVNPFGLGLYREIFATSFSPNLHKYVQEWHSPLSFPSVIRVANIGIFITLVGYYWRKLPRFLLLVSVFFFLTYVKAVRNETFFVLTAIPVILLALSKLYEEIFSIAERSYQQKFGLPVLALVLPVLCLVGGQVADPALKSSSHNPAEAVDFLKSDYKSGDRIFNNYSWGGYLIWQAPEVKVFVDGRMPHWKVEGKNSAMDDYVKAYYLKNGAEWKDIFAKWNIDLALLNNPSGPSVAGESGIFKLKAIKSLVKKIRATAKVKDRPILQNELIKAGWIVLYRDDTAILLRRPS